MRGALSPEGLAQACSAKPKRTIGAWLALLVLSFAVIAVFLGDALTSEGDVTNNPESKQAEALAVATRPPRPPASEIVIVHSPRYTVDDPAFRAAVSRVLAEGFERHAIFSRQDFYSTGNESLVSEDRHATMIPLLLAQDDSRPLVDVVRSEDGRDGFAVKVTGSITSDDDFEQLSQEDLQKGELFFGLPAALVILILVFGAVVAGLVPVALALISIIVAVALTALVGQAFDLSFFVVNMISGMGLALGIDYSLFVVSRYREERVRGLEKLDAIARSGATASRAITFSGLAFVLAMTGLLLVPDTVLRSLAVGAILVGIVSVLAALTLLPAVLALLGDKVNALAIPVLGRRAAESAGAEGQFWTGVVRRVMRRPGIWLVSATALLLLAAAPVLGMTIGSNGISTLPDRFASKQGYVLLAKEFPAASVEPAQIVVHGNAFSPKAREGEARLTAALAQEPAFGTPARASSRTADVVVVSVPVTGDADGEAAVSAIRDLRARLIPAAFADVDTSVLVGGTTAEDVDYFDLVNHWLPIVFVFVLGLSFILLTVAFRSIVVPAVAIALNLLSVGAAYGLLVLVFQDGVGHGLFGFEQVDTIEAWVPLFLFAVLFGLSMDYQVFLLSRIRERYTETGDTRAAVQFGVGSTARIITGAALIIIVVFAGFAAGDLVMFQQMGFGIAVALLIDATIVRSILVPAAMTLLGRWNWYFPAWLEWLPELQVEGHDAAPRGSPVPAE